MPFKKPNLRRNPQHQMEAIIECGTGAKAYEIVVEFPMANKAIRATITDPNTPAFKGKDGEELAAAIVTEVAKLTWRDNDKQKPMPVMVSRLKNGVRNDGPKGEPSYQIIVGNHIALEEHAINGKLNDGINGEAAFQVYENGLLKRATHYTNNFVTIMKSFSYSDAVFKEEDTSLKERLTRLFNKKAAVPPREWKTCYVTAEYRNADRLTTDGPHGTPGLQMWQVGYEVVDGMPATLKFSKQMKLTKAVHYKNGKAGAAADRLDKLLTVRKAWPAA